VERRELLLQSEYWVDGQNQVHRVSDMEIRYAQNLLNFLTDGNRPQMFIHQTLDMYFSGPMPNGEMAQDCLDGEIERLMELRRDRRRAKEWLLEKPLLEALRNRIDGHWEKQKPTHRDVIFVVKVRIPVDSDSGMLKFEIEEALERLDLDVEILGTPSA
jgi:hypothetical protein